MERISAIVQLISEVDKLKLIDRASYVGDGSRRENSAEHSWHLAFGLAAFARELDLKMDIEKALMMALIHDVCEIDAGDTPAFTSTREDQHEAELKCLHRLASTGLKLSSELRDLWIEYEEQQTPESRWVRVMDRLMPFISNVITQGKLWQENSITSAQVLKHNQSVKDQAPEVYEWMVSKIDECVAKGWLAK